MSGVEAGDLPLTALPNYATAGGSFQSKQPGKAEVHPAPDLPSLRRAHAWLLRRSALGSPTRMTAPRCATAGSTTAS